MIVIPGRIPIVIHPIFWVLAGMIGWFSLGSLLGALIWILIIFFSVLIHELGHALTAVAFGQKAQIQLVALGGLTVFEGPKLRFWQQFLVSFNGPLFGFFLYLTATVILQAGLLQRGLAFGIAEAVQTANLFWTVINLLPVLPLDGGQLLRIVLEGFFGLKGFKASLLIGSIIAMLFSFYFFIIQSFLAGAIFFLFAFQSFDSWRKSRFAQPSDRQEMNQQLLARAEKSLKEGKKEEAKALFEELVHGTKEGVLATAAAQYLAFLYSQENQFDKAYELLAARKTQLSEESLCLLHKLAADQKDFSLIAELSGDCYQASPTCDVALRNARAFASLNQATPAGGWLQTAFQQGDVDLEALLQEPAFAKLIDDPQFRLFIDQLKK